MAGITSQLPPQQPQSQDEILQARILEWVASCSLLQGIFPTQASPIAGGFFTSWAIREAQEYWSG